MKLYDLDTVLTFGQYKGETVLEILKKNSSYITNYCLKESEDFYITDEVLEASIIYGYKGSIDAHTEEGRSAEEALNILMDNNPNKNFFEEKRAFYKDYMLKRYEQELESQLSGNGNIIIKHSIF
ncbi:hypothetical protein MWU50_10280 [Flavobacteriaceae bacterium S0862]|nr:hypothetical protein [Flavobacteriaceae bacterium S0862]